MEQQDLLHLALEFTTAILLGALVGIEREKRKSEDEDGDRIAGLRTFTLLALLGATAGFLTQSLKSPWIAAVALVVVGAYSALGYYATVKSDKDGKGLTTEVAAIVVFLLGAMVTLGYREIAIGLGIVTAAVLAYKQPLHGFVDRLGWDDIYAALRLLIATFIALPLLPDRPIDPWGALNPYQLWLLVILISGLSLVGYVLTRLLGAAKGAALTGLAGGLVSSTALTLSFAREARDNPENTIPLAAGVLFAWGIMFIRVIVLVAVLNQALLGDVLTPFIAMALLSAGVGAFIYYRHGAAETDVPKGPVAVKNPFSLIEAAKFAALFAVVLLAVKLVQENFPPDGLYAVAALAGLTDVDVITLSMANYAKHGVVHVAVIAIVIAAISNTIVKCGMGLVLAGVRFAKPLAAATAVVVVAGAASIVLLR